MLFVIVSNFFISSITKEYLKVIFLGIILFLLIFEFGFEFNNSVNRKEILPNIIFCLLLYFFLAYISGLFIGFEKTIYKFNLSNIINNIIPTTLIIILSELIRYQFINRSSNNKFILISSCILFILFDISVNYSLYDLSIKTDVYKYIGLISFGSLGKNVFMTILCLKSDYFPCIVYRLIMELYVYLVPITPAFGPYISSVIGILLPLLLSFLVLDTVKRKILQSPDRIIVSKKINAIITVILLILVLLNSGFYKYQIFTIGSNSMRTFMSRGDVILVKKLKGKEIRTIKKGDILVFRYEKKIIAHRVYEVIKRDDGTFYKTKGDNNSQVDSNIVKKSDVIGITIYRVKYVGIPSIKLQDLFK